MKKKKEATMKDHIKNFEGLIKRLKAGEDVKFIIAYENKGRKDWARATHANSALVASLLSTLMRDFPMEAMLARTIGEGSSNQEMAGSILKSILKSISTEKTK